MWISDRLELVESGVAIVAAIAAVSPAMAQSDASDTNSESDFSVQLRVGAEYDSNVAVEDIDTNSGQDDVKFRFSGDLSYETSIAPDAELEIGYRFSQSLHEEFDEFDVQTHQASVELSQDYDTVGVDVGARYIHARLGGDSFIDLARLSAAVQGYVSEDLLVRGSYAFTDKDFAGRQDRDAKALRFTLTGYLFVDGRKTYLIGSSGLRIEEARDPQFDFTGMRFRLELVHRLGPRNRRSRLAVGARYEARDYSSITPSISAERSDDRFRFYGRLRVPVNSWLSVEPRYEFSSYDSNLPSADYEQHIAALTLVSRF